MKKLILDACCGGKMFWYNKNHPNATYMDNRKDEKGHSQFRPNHEVMPDIIADFKNMPFKDKSFKMVVFDPPHMFLGENAEFTKSYGRLTKDTWKDELKRGFDECWRVLDDYGTLIFKWNQFDIKKKKVLEVLGRDPLFGHTTNRSTKNTHWLCYMKIPEGDAFHESKDDNNVSSEGDEK